MRPKSQGSAPNRDNKQGPTTDLNEMSPPGGKADMDIIFERELVPSMTTMDLKVNRAQASGNAFLFLALTTVLGGGLIYLFWSGRIADEGPFGWILFSILMAWIFAFLIAGTLRLFRLRKFEGPLLQITERGIVDFWTTPHRTLLWEKIEYSEWKNPNLAPVLAFVPKTRGVVDCLRYIIGIPNYQYRSIYLDKPNDEIAQFLIEHAPHKILR